MPLACSMICLAPERFLHAGELGVASHDDFQRAPHLLALAVLDVREHPALGGLIDERGILTGDVDDHRTSALAHDLRDELERVLLFLLNADDGHVRVLALGGQSDLRGVGHLCDHSMSELVENRRDLGHSMPLRVRDQHTQAIDRRAAHRLQA
jgi:hypothetical protein